VIEKSSIAIIVLLDENNQTFAVCPVSDEGAVDRTTDSGRYFILRIENAQGKRAFIGIAFNERNDAFDFNVALSEHKGNVFVSKYKHMTGVYE
jgi:adaptin ear-binding coat-associated protein 1/2